ncbi:class I SAM-dependent methyltransferase [Mucilaginibacter jinjuensis]|uniref:Methyltransferase domain-containing protein n=1 Tax=Mucilaginibacter jinjuensis TaxID=1176721 RepID=A0ABY7T783_9SPHI|nr:methyltransferase domain-containing protein [Mucilaginibacter jinjuensis]WCT12088.1 methyltransferase domain-containing protein [Mucilaginibacter jinjuensis]
MSDILGQALHGYHHQKAKHKLWIHNQYGPKEEMPIAIYFREEDDMPDLEWLAVEQCRGKVLDIGGGAGSHALLLQEEDIDVTAIDISPLSVEVMKTRGVKQALVADIYTYNQGKYDTLLLLMNGIGLAGNIEGLKRLLAHLKTLMNEDAQLLFDSSDITYLYEGNLPAEGYYGEITYQYEYNQQKTDWFNWLYIDEHTMQAIAEEMGFTMEVLIEDEHGQYLARLTVN